MASSSKALKTMALNRREFDSGNLMKGKGWNKWINLYHQVNIVLVVGIFINQNVISSHGEAFLVQHLHLFQYTHFYHQQLMD